MLNKINKERRRSMNAIPTRSRKKKPVARSPGGSQTKTGQGKRQSMSRLITKILHQKKIIKSRNTLGSTDFQYLMSVPNKENELFFQIRIERLKRCVQVGGEYFKINLK
jgi:hypothetical protein